MPKITEYPTATSLTGQEFTVVVQNNATVKTNVSTLTQFVFSPLTVDAWDFSTSTKKSLILSTNKVLTIINSIAGQSVALLSVTQDATGSHTLSIAGTIITINTAANSVTLIAIFDLGGGVFAFDTNLTNSSNVVVPPSSSVEAVVWADFLNTVAGTVAGGINGLNNATPAGARATKKLAPNGYVEFNFANDGTSDGIVLILDITNTTNYAYSGFKAGLYKFGANIYYDINGANSGTLLGPVGTNRWLRIERATNDLIFKTSPDGITYTTLITSTGILSGITDLFVKSSFAVNSSAATIVTVRGLLSII